MAAGLPRPHHVLLLHLFLLCLCCAFHMAPTTATAAAAGGSDGDGASALLGLLQRVQTEALRALGPDGFDAKLYVDLPLATDERAAAAALPGRATSRAELESYLARYFGAAGSDLVAADPPDFEAEPRGFLPRVGSPQARAWALEVHALWKDLTRRVAPGVAARPERHTLLPLPGRVVVPGSRFREVYYWDSYWVVRGLLVSKMYDTAKDIVLNLVYMVEKYGFVLNGARSYYTNRRNSTDMTTLATTYIIPVDLNTFIFKMEWDIAAFAKLVGEDTTSEKFIDASKARHLAIDSILWNSEMEQWLDYWLPTDGDCQQGVYQWKSDSQNRKIFASNFIPLWLNAHHSGSVQFADAAKSERVMASLQTSGLLHAAGIATSLTNTSQQWDFPNGWAPVQHLIVEGLLHSGSEETRKLAEDIATRWVRTNYAAYKATGAMHEKYDVEACGKSGGGGEYKPQTGFGWSNGVVLSFLEEFGWPEDKEIDCSRRGEIGLA
ncbi:putative trehalase [Dichanthelium oligosanthes]|uniref:Trehalase n=1 Tax=Dichanthelium oligosanthes TaxID=888268 RepID=A0A1E5W4Z1_9POAL|nr:putative trehalase [Dichanthelium oligosanthes]